ncbi:MarR family winged helix-turn-helix transcriptional regulator [Rhodobacter sp. KR11]|uniref:MarR family winged helix-turn-helix transcriptional regulator n=1 Tax=Rhodobacter sp. KR11 TaxID=2974588 RepID=UPI002221F650|nr:MarR family winged helix-turn-helix transcriptional regulator [Rhodobacter sp. KR11]MCW1917306.1 MarR family winged helix-turn-helix transcriptional regulator [Rhodobacter sp. KR11]
MQDASPKPLSIETIHEIRDNCLCLATQRAARVLARRFDRLFAPLSITNGQFSMMVALSGQWRPKLSELAQFLAMDQATMTAAVKALERRGLLTLAPDATDGRIRRPILTEEGARVVDQAAPLWKSEHAKLAIELEGQARAISALLAKI